MRKQFTQKTYNYIFWEGTLRRVASYSVVAGGVRERERERSRMGLLERLGLRESRRGGGERERGERGERGERERSRGAGLRERPSGLRERSPASGVRDRWRRGERLRLRGLRERERLRPLPRSLGRG